MNKFDDSSLVSQDDCIGGMPYHTNCQGSSPQFSQICFIPFSAFIYVSASFTFLLLVSFTFSVWIYGRLIVLVLTPSEEEAQLSFQTFVLFHCRLVVFNQLMVFGIMYWKWKDIDKTLKLLLLFMYSYESEHSISKFVLRFFGSWLERVVSKQVNHRRWWCDVWPSSKQVCFCVQTHAPPWIVGNFSLLRKRFDGFLTLHFLLSLLLIWNIR